MERYARRMTQKRLILVVGGIIAALLAAVLMVGVAIFVSLDAQQREANYQDCMARHGFQHDAPPAEADDAYVDALVQAADRCTELR